MFLVFSFGSQLSFLFLPGTTICDQIDFCDKSREVIKTEKGGGSAIKMKNKLSWECHTRRHKLGYNHTSTEVNYQLGRNRTYFVDGGNNWGGDTAQR